MPGRLIDRLLHADIAVHLDLADGRSRIGPDEVPVAVERVPHDPLVNSQHTPERPWNLFFHRLRVEPTPARGRPPRAGPESKERPARAPCQFLFRRERRLLRVLNLHVLPPLRLLPRAPWCQPDRSRKPSPRNSAIPRAP